MKKPNDSDFSKKKLVLLGSLFVFVLILVISGLYFLGGRVLVSSDQGVTKPTEIIPRIEKGAGNFSEIVVDWAQSLGRNPESNGYKNWQTYKSEQLGIELKYPDGYLLKTANEKISINKEEYKDFQTEYPLISVYAYDSNLDLTNWLNLNKVIFIGDQTIEEEPEFNQRKSVKYGNLSGFEISLQGMGEVRYTILKNGNKIVVVEGLSLSSFNQNEEFNEKYYSIIDTIKIP